MDTILDLFYKVGGKQDRLKRLFKYYANKYFGPERAEVGGAHFQMPRQLTQQEEENCRHSARVGNKYIEEADPTERNTYSDWITKIFINESIRLPEDAQDVSEIIGEYERLKAQGVLQEEHKNIYNFSTFPDLSRAIAEYEGVQSKGEERRQQAIAGAELIYEDETDQAWRITTPEAAGKLGCGSRWCVRFSNYAESYLSNGPLYMVHRDGEPYIGVGRTERPNTHRRGSGYSEEAYGYEFFDRHDEQIGREIAEDSIPVLRALHDDMAATHVYQMLYAGTTMRPANILQPGIKQELEELKKKNFHNRDWINNYEALVSQNAAPEDDDEFLDIVGEGRVRCSGAGRGTLNEESGDIEYPGCEQTLSSDPQHYGDDYGYTEPDDHYNPDQFCEECFWQAECSGSERGDMHMAYNPRDMTPYEPQSEMTMNRWGICYWCAKDSYGLIRECQNPNCDGEGEVLAPEDLKPWDMGWNEVWEPDSHIEQFCPTCQREWFCQGCSEPLSEEEYRKGNPGVCDVCQSTTCRDCGTSITDDLINQGFSGICPNCYRARMAEQHPGQQFLEFMPKEGILAMFFRQATVPPVPEGARAYDQEPMDDSDQPVPSNLTYSMSENIERDGFLLRTVMSDEELARAEQLVEDGHLEDRGVVYVLTEKGLDYLGMRV